MKRRIFDPALRDAMTEKFIQAVILNAREELYIIIYESLQLSDL
jgi:hypothetical protein